MTIDSGATPIYFLYVRDREAALAFYRDTLGLQLRATDPFGDFLDMGPALVRMTQMVDHRPSPHPLLGWDVPDLQAAVSDLRDRGIAFSIYEGMGQDDSGIWTAPDGRTRLAWFPDPDGNILSLSQIER